MEIRESKTALCDLQSSIFYSQISPMGVVLWASVQLLAILLAASEFPVWAHHPVPQTVLALDEMVVVQLISVSLLCPILAAGWPTVFCNILFSLAYTELAGLLANESTSRILRAWLLTSIWMFGVCGWMRQFSKNRQYHISIVAILFCSGGILAGYLRAENAGMSTGDLAAGPTVGPLAEYLAGHKNLGWIQTATPAILYLAWSIISRWSTSLRRHSTYLH
jgi:hypothetical protein